MSDDSAKDFVPETGAASTTHAFAEVKASAQLPDVLLIGDSISIGYTPGVRERLRATANVLRPTTNCGSTAKGIEQIDEWLFDHTWSVVHFNWGLHDLKRMFDGRRQVEPEVYEDNLRRLTGRLSETGAHLIWASTTPVPAGTTDPVRDPSDVPAYNDIAAGVMHEYGIQINDLHNLVLPRLNSLQQPANVHFTPDGDAVLAEQVAGEIARRIR